MKQARSLLIATSNPGKVKEFQKLLAPMFACEPAGKQAPTVVEDGKTYRENALKKARGYFEVFQRPLLVDDSGLETDALGGEPGVDSATFGGESLSWPERWELVQKRLREHPKASRTARFRCVLCYFDGKKPEFFEGSCEGTIVDKPKGQRGFGYDSIFLSDELGKTFGEASDDEKAGVSHRTKAVKAFLSWATLHLA